MIWSHHFAMVSKLAYLDNEKKKWKELGYTYSKFFDVDGAQAYVLWSKDYITITFRGTEPDDWNDISADLKVFKYDGMHEGFHEEYMKLHDLIRDKVDDLIQRKERPLYICGHSLGGAMATICATRYPEAKELYTYGSPRVFNKERAARLHVPHKRHVNNNDAVPRVPLWIMGFRHHGTEHYLNIKGNVCKMSLWQRVKDKWLGRWEAFLKGKPFDSLYDHSIDEYAKYLEDGK